MCSAQSSKTQTVMLMVAWAIAESPGPGMWVMAAGDEAKTFSRIRLMPMLEQCKPVAKLFPENRHHKSTLEINFASMPLILNGANSESKLQSKPCRYLWLDEVRNYPPGAYDMVLKRTRAYWNAKTVTLSTPDLADDEVSRAYESGDMRQYHVACPHCASGQPLVWKQMRWDRNDITCPGGEWDYQKVAETVRYECISCKGAILDKMDVRKALARSGIWVKTNTKNPSNSVSFTWNAILPPWVRWASLVEEFLRAKAAFKMGAIEPLKTFINESLGEPWSEQYFFVGDTEPQLFEVNSEWPEEAYRFLTIDVQAEGVCWWVARAWSKKGHSRRIGWGRAVSFDDLRVLQQDLKIQDNRVLIDSGFETKRVYQVCCRYGWIALKGEEAEYFAHIQRRGNQTITIRRSYAAPVRGDPEIGTSEGGRRYAQLIRWSNPTIKDRLRRIRDGDGWMVPNIESALESDYKRQMSSEYKKQVISKETGRRKWIWYCPSGNNHAFDCECMQVLAATLVDVLQDSVEVQPEEKASLAP